jgi:type I restriction enzyme M protein
VIEQITFLIFVKRLDEMQQVEEHKSTTLGTPLERRIFPDGNDERGEQYQNLRWSRFKHFAGPEMFRIVDEHVFPFIRALDGTGSAYARHMRDARFQIPSPALLAKVVDKLDKLDMGDRDTKGDVYEYMLAKIASAGQNGQFRTPRHIIATMVELVEPKPEDMICDPAAGTCGFLVAAGEHLRQHHADLFRDEKLRRHFHGGLFNGFDYETTAKDLQRIVKTKKTELLFLALFLRLLKIGGRAAVIVPDGVLFGSSKAHKDLRRILVEENKLDAVIKLPSGVFRPYAGVSTAILVFTRAGVGGTDQVWFYDVRADDKLGPTPAAELTEAEAVKNNLPELVKRWRERDGAERARPRTAQSFCVPKADIAAAGYDLSLNRHREVEHAEVTHESPDAILADLRRIEGEIAEGMTRLEEMVR